ncbi:unnamed protein product [Heligmosomoides polygyrus]|uniref:Uncharacterized protein n=1 Tax=Heligmosomoides polygyrus TaxID=6339 RepID=A0A3P8D8M3_HELPZ|nr:unnamed protein product [Heligmosomoides polygyrus]
MKQCHQQELADMRSITALLFTFTTIAAQDFAALLGPLLGGGGGAGGGGIGSILSSLGGGGGGKGPDIASLFQLGAGLLGKGGGGLPALPIPGVPPGPAPKSAVAGGPSNIVVPDYSDYEGEKPRPKAVTETPDALSPPSGLAFIGGGTPTTASTFESDYDIIGMSNTPLRAPPPPPEFTPVGRSEQRAPNPLFHNPNAHTFVTHQATLPPPRIYPQNAPSSQLEQQWHFPPPTAAPFVPPPATLPALAPPEITSSNPQLLAHNAARMIREIATFSDVHHGANDDYGAVQTLMEAFFESLTDPKHAPAVRTTAVFGKLCDVSDWW